MNHHPITLIVRSLDGVEFAVATDSGATSHELRFAATQTAAQLATHGDFVRVSNGTNMTEAMSIQRALDRAKSRWGSAGAV